jgi:surface carbohydrate biosynthesis protein
MNGPVLIIPCETQAREFDAKLLLACFGAERGFRVITGSKKEINKRIGSMPRSLFVSKSLTGRNVLMYELLDRLGHTVVCGDEEALVYASPASYLQHKVSAPTLRRARTLLAWGPRNEQLWREYEGYHGAPIHVTGNARMDLLRPELRPLFEAEVARIRDRYGRFVLINTNFSRLNHYFPGQSRQRRVLETDAAGRGGAHLVHGLAAHKARLYEHFTTMVPALARACPDCTIVLRPHPSERRETWRDLTRDHTNVRVVHEGSVVPWLIASQLMIHNGCQTAVEAYLLGAAAIAYQPTTSEEFDLQLPNLLSQRVFELEGLLEQVRCRLDGSFRSDPTRAAKQEELMDEFLAARSGTFASERIVDVLEVVGREPVRRSALAPRLLARCVAESRGLMQRLEAYWPGHHNNRVFLRHMFPGVSLAEVESRISDYAGLLGRFEKLQARQLHSNVFEITAS